MFALFDRDEGNIQGALPEGFDAWESEHQLVLRCGLDGAYGETRLYAWKGALVGATRSSIMNDFEPVWMSAPARVEVRGLDCHLILSLRDGGQVRVPIMIADRDRITALVEVAPGVLEPPAPRKDPVVEAPSPRDEEEPDDEPREQRAEAVDDAEEATQVEVEQAPEVVAREEPEPEPEPEVMPAPEEAPAPEPEELPSEEPAREDERRSDEDETRVVYDDGEFAGELAEELADVLTKELEREEPEPARARSPIEVVTLPEGAIVRIGSRLMRRWGESRADNTFHALQISTARGFVVGACKDASARSWSIETGEILHEFGPLAGEVTALALSSDGLICALGSSDGVVELWDTERGEFFLGMEHHASVSALAMVPDGELVAIGLEDGKVLLRDAVSGSTFAFFQECDARVIGLSADARSTHVVAMFANGEVHRCDFGTGESRRLAALRGDFVSMGLSPGGDRVVMRTRDTIKVGNLTSKEKGFGIKINGLVDAIFVDGGDALATCRRDGTIAFYSMTDHGLIRQVETMTSSSALAISEDSRVIATGHYRVELFRSRDGGEAMHQVVGHRAPIVNVHLSPYGDEVATSSRDGSVLGWSIERGELSWELRDGRLGIVSPDERWLVTSRQRGVALWSNSDDREVGLLSGLPGHARALAFSPDTKLLAAQYWSSPLVVWDMERELARFECNSTEQTRAFAFSADSSLLVTAGERGLLEVWEAASGSVVSTIKHPGSVSDVCFTWDGRAVVVAGVQGDISLWSVESSAQLYEWELGEERPRCVAAAPGGERLVVGCASGEVISLDLGTGKERGRWRAHDMEVSAIAFSEEHALMATASVDMTALIWNLEVL